MKYGLVGHLCLDVIHLPDGSEVQSYGGIFFSLASLANIVDDEDIIYPVFGVGDVDYDKFIERIKIYPNVVTDGIFKFSGFTNRVHLFYQDRNERTECSMHIAKPIEFERLKFLLEVGVDGIFINMISGFDVELETLRKLRSDFNGYIHFDIHSATLGVDEKNVRFRRRMPNWKEWLENVDTVQMNEFEARSIGEECWDDDTLAKNVLDLGVKVMVITKANLGATVYYFANGFKRVDLKAFKVDVVDPTGCGDVFGSAFFYRYSKTLEPVISAEFANYVAGLNATIPGSTHIDKLKELVKK
ncbi:carbohydrate kinase family protein [Candidatus Kryptobacter tengchongensis]|uniref:Sugar or nucleoside kinase, ribokinase family n=1 Tax=Kryptobacter tengchongensis TaxID=1643429 RepID=A0A656D131_KRYT1|nr:carbohydrate kinase family protein [Candidatus Kryptobacter tengchongensis]CUS96031.1 Sugar or nucleoside kinase, ribokinase family [Candidatus Kryptobacter tengchongensis]